jgi:hypothetical protein
VIAVLLTMLRARWAQAVTVFVLSVVATAAAVAGPVSLHAVDGAMVRNEVADASNDETSMRLSGPVNPSAPRDASAFATFVRQVTLPGFHTIAAGELQAFGPVAAGDPGLASGGTARVAFRADVCQHIVIASGRCLAGALDVLIGVDTARRQGFSAGQHIDLQAERITPNGVTVPDGRVATLTIAGLYQPRDPNEAYWGSQFYFPTRPDGTRDEAAFVSPSTFDLIDHTVGFSAADSLAPPSAFAPDRLDALGEEVAHSADLAQDNDAGFSVVTDIPDLLARIRGDEQVAGVLVPVAFLPLVALSWFVVFLAVGYGVTARRRELALVNLRGVRAVRRWWLALGETVVMIALGAPVGYLLGYLVVDLVARRGLGYTGGSGSTLAGLPYAAAALAGALAFAVLGQRRALREPVVDLLRGVARTRPAWKSTVVEAALVVLAILGVLQLRGADGGVTGVSLLVPGLVVVGVALLAAHALVPLVALAARRALHRGWLGVGLAAVQIARRPGSQRMLTLLAVAIGLVAFVAAALSVADQARVERAGLTVGASRVITTTPDSAAHLLSVTHSVDPAGDWAMAVEPLDQTGAAAPPVLAIDSGRLTTVADWQPAFGVSAETLATRLRPPASAAPLVLRADSFTVDVGRGQPFGLVDTDGDGVADANAPVSTLPVQLTFAFESLADGSEVSSTVAVLPGRRTYRATASGCAGGCRLTGFDTDSVPDIGLTITLYRMTSHAGDVVSAGAAPQSRWRGMGPTRTALVDGGLQATVDGNIFNTGNLSVSAVDEPVPVPVFTIAGHDVPTQIIGLDGNLVRVASAGTATMLPRLGSDGLLVDLDYVNHVSLGTASTSKAEVWLGPAAPADAVERLRTAGLYILDVDSLAATEAHLDRVGPALALRFHTVAAGLGIGLALAGLWLAAAVDRRRRAADLRALRLQGLRPGLVRRAVFWEYLWLVGGACTAGLLAGALAWVTTGDHLPVLTDTTVALPAPRWPVLSAVAVPWAMATVAMLAVAVGVALLLCRTVRIDRFGKG